MTARRRFFGRLAAMAAGLLGVAACGKEAETKLSSEAGRKLLDAFVDTIVPKDQDPGAVEAGVSDELWSWFNERQEEKNNVLLMLGSIDLAANRKYKKGFIELTLDQRETVVDKLLNSLERKDNLSRNMAYRLRTRILRSFYLSPAGREMLAYTTPYPAGYPDYNRPPSD